MSTTATVLIVLALIGYFLYRNAKNGRLDFWKLAEKYPNEAVVFFSNSEHWHIGTRPVGRDVIGPMPFVLPRSQRVVKLYCDAEVMDALQDEFIAEAKQGFPNIRVS